MQFESTRHRQSPVSFGAALEAGLAADGGLYVPTQWPRMTLDAPADDLAAVAEQVLRPFVAGDPLADVTELERVKFVMAAGTLARVDA